MELFGIEAPCKVKPALEKEFIPIALWTKRYLQKARETFTVAITGDHHRCVVTRTKIRNDGSSLEADKFYVTQLVKTLLWMYGGYKISIVGSKTMFKHIQTTFSLSGARSFDVEFMSSVYQEPFTVELLNTAPREVQAPRFMGQHLNGYRIGLAINERERKVAAVANGKILYTEEVMWHPVGETDPDYHTKGVLDSIHAAAKRLPRIDAIGVSSAGVHVNQQVRFGEPFRSLSTADFQEHIENMFLKSAGIMGSKMLEVENEGDVAALAGAMNLDAKSVLSVVMGSSQTSGFLDGNGNLTGWLNRLSAVPINLSPTGPEDMWSKDIGCGSSYFSTEGLFRLATLAGIRLDNTATERENLRTIQSKAQQGDSKARLVYSSLGTILGHTLAYYHGIYRFQCVLLQGPLMVGEGGDLLFNAAQKVLVEEYSSIAGEIIISLPEENHNNIGQAVAAATLSEC